MLQSGFVLTCSFYTKCAVLAAHLCSYNLQQCDATPRTLLGELTALPRPLAWSFGRGKKGERRRKIKRGEKERGEMERK